MRYLIDGNNLMHAVREQGFAPTPARDSLCKLVADWARRCGAEVTVVFDGCAPRAGLLQQIQQPGIAVRFSGLDSADAVIEGEAGQAAAPTEIVVVTSDRAIHHEVRYRRARTVNSEDFAAQLFAQAKAEPLPAAQKAPEKPEQVTADDAEEWVNRFSKGAEDAVDEES